MKTGLDRFRQQRADDEEIARLEVDIGDALTAARGGPRVSDEDLPDGDPLPPDAEATVAYGLTRRSKKG